MNETKRILITGKVEKECIDILKRGGLDVDIKLNISQEKLMDEIENYDVLIIRSSTKVDKEILDRGKKLEVIGRAGNG